jgi:hypothetical protein
VGTWATLSSNNILSVVNFSAQFFSYELLSRQTPLMQYLFKKKVKLLLKRF